MESLLEFKSVNLKLGGKQLLENIRFVVNKGEHWAIVGPSGSGKTCLAESLAGKVFFQGEILRHFEGDIGFVPQQHKFTNKANLHNFYYQQRFQSQDSDDSYTVAETLENNPSPNPELLQELIDVFKLGHLLEKPLLHLSNGENKRLQITKALLHKPAILLLDHPFIGLDVLGRKDLHQLLNQLMSDGLPIMIITSPSEIPTNITHVLEMDQGKCIYAGELFHWKKNPRKQDERYQLDKILLSSLNTRHLIEYETMIEFRNVSIRYKESEILHNINWKVNQGNCWCVSGPNGAGKSTLLSLITADNPQAYANEIYLFGKKKGSGESIWQIKKRIGYVSPELHLYFPQSCSCFDVVASGLFDTIGLFRTLSETQLERVALWINVMKLESIALKGLHQVSLSQQRMILLARALVKNPPLLVLDEPCQGLDDEQTRFINEIVDQLCYETGTTLIYVSHYQNQLPTCIDKVLQINKGRGEISETN